MPMRRATSETLRAPTPSSVMRATAWARASSTTPARRRATRSTSGLEPVAIARASSQLVSPSSPASVRLGVLHQLAEQASERRDVLVVETGPQPPVERAGRAAQPEEELLAAGGPLDPLHAPVAGLPFPRDETGALQAVEVVAECGLPDADHLGQFALGAVARGLQREQDQPGRGGAAGRDERVVERTAQRLGRAAHQETDGDVGRRHAATIDVEPLDVYRCGMPRGPHERRRLSPRWR